MSTIIRDSLGNEIKKLDNLGGATLTDTRTSSFGLGAVNAETVLFCANTNSVAVEVRGTYVGTLVLQYSIDGINYDAMPIFNPTTEVFLANVTSVGKFVGHLPSGTRQVRVLMTAYTSGIATVSLRGSEGGNFIYAKPIPTTLSVTATGALSATVTASLPAVTGLHHYITRIRISKYVGANLTPAAAPTIVGSTNLPSTPNFDFKTLGSQGDIEVVDLDFTGNPLKSTTAGTVTTFAAPVLTGAIWKLQAFYYVGL